MIKVAWSAGHGMNTSGKRTPDDEREWSFNNQVVHAAMAYLAKYEGVQQLRLDDPSGKTDVPLMTRTNKANEWQADVYISCHHNALSGVWGAHSGVETYVMVNLEENSTSLKLASTIHPHAVKAMGLSDRGIKFANFHELRETNMPAVLVEGGFMDSRIDIMKMRDGQILQSQGVGIARGVAEYLNLKLIEDFKPIEGVRYLKPSTSTLMNEFITLLQNATNEGILGDSKWVALAKNRQLSLDDALCLLATIENRKQP
ncbi:N-acetylmuramoyl-L-alanine amidase family protein [Paenisporosarcina indica]|uniref:N-acetylmuramoyl-L-alanine amidase family protein n=1 Tax=Paenisporosarcina indica TaxID=650093 RepID=UPI00095027E0|nr:N-acetylmuramoyl-L-alanine amidase [Paenisporosarcina indica]